MIAEIEKSNQLIDDWFTVYFENTGGIFLLLVIVAFVYLFVRCEELRGKFLLPIAVMMFITFNPILYKYVFSKIIYWRLFWMLPGAILIAVMLVVLIKQLSRVWMKWGVLIVAIILIMTYGLNMFECAGFEITKNWEKLDQETIDVCDIILEVDDNPRIVAPYEISTEIRQYAPEIFMLYGRNIVYGYIRGSYDEEREIYSNIIQQNFDLVLSNTTRLEINFVVVDMSTEIDSYWLEKYSYKEIARTEEYIIYYNEEM